MTYGTKSKEVDRSQRHSNSFSFAYMRVMVVICRLNLDAIQGSIGLSKMKKYEEIVSSTDVTLCETQREAATVMRCKNLEKAAKTSFHKKWCFSTLYSWLSLLEEDQRLGAN